MSKNRVFSNHIFAIVNTPNPAFSTWDAVRFPPTSMQSRCKWERVLFDHSKSQSQWGEGSYHMYQVWVGRERGTGSRASNQDPNTYAEGTRRLCLRRGCVLLAVGTHPSVLGLRPSDSGPLGHFISTCSKRELDESEQLDAEPEMQALTNRGSWRPSGCIHWPADVSASAIHQWVLGPGSWAQPLGSGIWGLGSWLRAQSSLAPCHFISTSIHTYMYSFLILHKDWFIAYIHTYIHTYIYMVCM